MVLFPCFILCSVLGELCPVDCFGRDKQTLSGDTTRQSSTSELEVFRPPGRCLLPEHPIHGTYNSTLCHPSDQRPACQNIPGTPVPAQWQLMYSCHDGYSLTTDGNEYSECDGDNWTNPIDCIHGSSLLPHVSTNGASGRRKRQSAAGKPVEGVCILPEYPQNGAYKSVLCQPSDQRPECSNTPGTPVTPYWVLQYTCDTDYNLTRGVSPVIVCINGSWGVLPECLKLCPPLNYTSLDIRCSYLGQDVPCDQPMKAGTRARARCKQHYIEMFPQKPPITCGDDGDWSSKLFHCIPVCGVSLGTNPLSPVIRDGSPTKRGDFPWLAALFLKNDTGLWDQQCSGTLISPHMVLTAAHCLFDKLEVRRKPEEIKVGLGKYSRDYYTHENFSQIFDVREILVPESYSGRRSYYSLDIGLLDLAHSVQVTGYIMPACMEWSSPTALNTGDVGVVAGWGTTENDTGSDFVLSTRLTYIDNYECLKKLWQPLGPYLTADKFCAEKNSGGQVDRGDRGGGLTFLKNGLHTLYGVVSTRVINATQVSLFTDIKTPQHMKWLENQEAYLNEFTTEYLAPYPSVCTLPEQPQNGAFTSLSCQPGDKLGACSNIPGTPVPTSWLIKYTCNTNFTLSPGDSPFAECNNGTWNNLQNCLSD